MHSRKKKTGKKDVCEETSEIYDYTAFSHIQLRELVYYSTFLFFNAVDK